MGVRCPIILQVKKMIKFASITNKGERTHNEDAIGVFSNKGISGCIVCDGLGGHGMGDIASSITVDLFGDTVSTCQDIDRSFFERFFDMAQNRLQEEQRARHVPNKMKTTAAVLLLDDNKARFGHIGDTRVYVFGQMSIQSRTFDHSVPEALARAGIILESEIRHHPDRNKLLKVLGDAENIAEGSISDEIDLSCVKAFLLCSDGFWEHITEETMCDLLLESHSSNDWICKMTKEVLKNGEAHDMDNYSAIAVWIY